MALNIAELVQAFLEDLYLGIFLRAAVEKDAQPPHASCLLLRARKMRPSYCRAANYRKELATPHLQPEQQERSLRLAHCDRRLKKVSE